MDEDGAAIHTSDFGAWRPALESEGWDWLGPRDRVHFDFEGGNVRDDVGNIGVMAFQVLWNKHNPNDRIDEDELYGSDTAARLDRSPADGFGQPDAPRHRRHRILRLVRPNMRGEDVRKVQKALMSKGFLDPGEPGSTDGIYGPATAAADEAMQRKHGLPEGGVVGRQTRRAHGIDVAGSTVADRNRKGRA